MSRNSRFAQAARQLGLAGANVRPYRVGGVSVRPHRVGAPALMTPNLGEPPVEYSEQEYASGGNNYLGLGITSIPALAVGFPVQINTVRPFTIMELRCPSTVIGLFLDNIDIQGITFFSNRAGQGVPIELFSEVSRLRGLDAITVQPATGLTLFVSNPTAGALNLMGAFRGTQVLPAS